QLHYMHNWSQEDRNDQIQDNEQTDQVNEANVPDGSLTVLGFNATIDSDPWGYLGVGAAYIEGEDVFTLRGLITYGNEGEHLTDRWWGVTTGGTGKLYVAAINYSASIGKMVAHPTPFGGDGPDIIVNAGFHIAGTETEFEPFDGRIRH